jgi:hypothetical protein
MRSLWVCLLLLLCSGSAHADEDLVCNPNATGSATLAQAVALQSAGVITDGQPVKMSELTYGPSSSCGTFCGAAGGVSGVMLRRVGSQVCVGLPSKGKLNTIFGWIPASRWRSNDNSPQPLERWVGVWQNQSGKITVRIANADQLHIVGAGVWVHGDNVNMGGFDVTDAPQDGVVLGEDDSCQIAMRVVGDYLVAADNGNCGGINVRFNGMYRFRHR